MLWARGCEHAHFGAAVSKTHSHVGAKCSYLGAPSWSIADARAATQSFGHQAPREGRPTSDMASSCSNGRPHWQGVVWWNGLLVWTDWRAAEVGTNRWCSRRHTMAQRRRPNTSCTGKTTTTTTSFAPTPLSRRPSWVDRRHTTIIQGGRGGGQCLAHVLSCGMKAHLDKAFRPMHSSGWPFGDFGGW